ncbi:hypothetical protein WJX77_012689 [Trebouxia sp. C0004]
MTRQKAFRMLEAEYHWMVNLVCQAHGLALLIKDLYKHVPELKEPLNAAIDINMLTRGNQVWQQSHGDVLDSAEALQRAVNDSSFQITAADAQEIRQHKTDFSFVESLQRAVRLLEPILALLQGATIQQWLLIPC